MSKTAIQQAIEKVEIMEADASKRNGQADNYQDATLTDYEIGILRQVKTKLTSLLPTEKEQIEQAYQIGGDTYKAEASEYYTNTYGQTK